MRALCVAVLTLTLGCGSSGGEAKDAAVNDGAALDAVVVDAAAALDAALADAARSCVDDLPAPVLVDPARTAELAVVGDPGSPTGIFDPSVVYPLGAPGGAMSYSSVTSTASIRTRIALSGDRGVTWTYVADANAVAALTIPSTDAAACPGGTCTGNLINEVSSLLIDPLDPDPARRWKLITHRYLVLPPTTLRYDYGHIALATAPEPQGPWTTPTPLIGWPSTSTFSSAGAATTTTGLGLPDCLVLTEPGAFLRGAEIDLVVGCVAVVGGAPQIRMELLRSTDHARTFTRVRTLLNAADAACLGEPGSARLNAGELFTSGGQEYLIATPEVTGQGYRGCVVMPIDDPVTGAVRRGPTGAPVVLRRFTAARFTGACSYAEGTTTGYLVPIAFLDQPRVFRIFKSGQLAP